MWQCGIENVDKAELFPKLIEGNGDHISAILTNKTKKEEEEEQEEEFHGHGTGSYGNHDNGWWFNYLPNLLIYFIYATLPSFFSLSTVAISNPID